MLEEWATLLRDERSHEAVDDDALIFPNSLGKYLHATAISTRILTPAMQTAGIPKIGDGETEPRSFHTFRHCYAAPHA